MSLDKFVMRGFTGSVGSGEGRWIASSAPSNKGEPATTTQHPAGSSFVMGGGGLRPKPAAPSSCKGPYSQHDSSKGEGAGGGERYSYDVEKTRYTGTQHDYNQHPGCFGSKSLNEAINSKRGHQAMVGIALYGIGLFILIFCLVALFGDGKNDGFYVVPGMSKKARPMWARD